MLKELLGSAGFLYPGRGTHTWVMVMGVLRCKDTIFLQLQVAKCNELLVVLCSNDNALHVQRILLSRILKYFKLIKGNLKSVQFFVMLFMQPSMLKPSLVAH